MNWSCNPKKSFRPTLSYILNYKLSYEYILNHKPSYILNYKLYIMIWIINWIMRPLPATSTTSTVRPSHSSGTGVRLKVWAIKSHWDCNGSDTLTSPPPTGLGGLYFVVVNLSNKKWWSPTTKKLFIPYFIVIPCHSKYRLCNYAIGLSSFEINPPYFNNIIDLFSIFVWNWLLTAQKADPRILFQFWKNK